MQRRSLMTLVGKISYCSMQFNQPLFIIGELQKKNQFIADSIAIKMKKACTKKQNNHEASLLISDDDLRY